MKIGYIIKTIKNNRPKFDFREATYERRISSKGDRIFSKMLAFPFDYNEVLDNTNLICSPNGMMLVQEPFFIDDNDAKERALRWIEYANKTENLK